jgi:hypothetical protein
MAVRQPIVTREAIASRDWHRKQTPVWRVDEAARTFFGKSASWLRGKLSPDPDHPLTWFVSPDGTPMEFLRSDPDKADSARLFSLADIEPMARSLHALGAFHGTGPDARTAADQRLEEVLGVVRAVTILYGLGEDAPAARQASGARA